MPRYSRQGLRPSFIPGWGSRLEGRVDMQGVLRALLEKHVTDQAAEMAKRNDRIEALLTTLSEDVVAARIQLGTACRSAGNPTR